MLYFKQQKKTSYPLTYFASQEEELCEKRAEKGQPDPERLALTRALLPVSVGFWMGQLHKYKKIRPTSWKGGGGWYHPPWIAVCQVLVNPVTVKPLWTL